jgi:hypothetical protein
MEIRGLASDAERPPSSSGVGGDNNGDERVRVGNAEDRARGIADALARREVDGSPSEKEVTDSDRPIGPSKNKTRITRR